MIYLLDEIDLNIWKTKSIILRELKRKNIFISERRLRDLIRKHNEKYIDGIVDYYVAHDNQKGYIKTTDVEIIKKSIKDNFTRAVNQMKFYHKTLKFLKTLDNTQLDLKELMNEYS